MHIITCENLKILNTFKIRLKNLSIKTDKMDISVDVLNKLSEGWHESEVDVYLQLKYGVNLSDPQIKSYLERVGQDYFRKKLIERYQHCVVSKASIPLEACHIIPHAIIHDCFNIDNGLLLTRNIHYYFDNYYFSINPETLKVELRVDVPCPEMNPYVGTTVNEISHYPGTIKYLKSHYTTFIQSKKNEIG